MTAARTVALIKPDAVRRKLVGTILSEIEARGFEVCAAGVCGVRSFQVRRSTVEEFYAEHMGRPYFDALIDFMLSGQFWALELAAAPHVDVVAYWRASIGPSAIARRQPGHIRHAYAMDAPEMENLVHGSDSAEAASREASLLYRMGWL